MNNILIKKPLFPVVLSCLAAISTAINATALNATASETTAIERSADQNPVTLAQMPVDEASVSSTNGIPDVGAVEVAANMPVADPAVADPATVVTEVAVTEVAVTEVVVARGDRAEALNFNPPSSNPGAVPEAEATTATKIVETPPSQTVVDPPSVPEKGAVSLGGEKLFQGGSESLVARTVGAAEGTRAADGGKTSLYEGHTDPGNGVWNRGTFSYQFGNEENLTAEEADRRQVAKIQRIYESVMVPKAIEKQVTPLSLAEELNGIDLINQAPLAVTEEGGYVERLAEAKKKGLSGDEAILEARVWAFWDANKGGWDAPGLRAYDDLGKEASIRHDQDRRMDMINQALEAYQQQHGAIASRG
jgi:hypothetical protein